MEEEIEKIGLVKKDVIDEKSGALLSMKFREIQGDPATFVIGYQIAF